MNDTDDDSVVAINIVCQQIGKEVSWLEAIASANAKRTRLNERFLVPRQFPSAFRFYFPGENEDDEYDDDDDDDAADKKNKDQQPSPLNRPATIKSCIIHHETDINAGSGATAVPTSATSTKAPVLQVRKRWATCTPVEEGSTIAGTLQFDGVPYMWTVDPTMGSTTLGIMANGARLDPAGFHELMGESSPMSPIQAIAGTPAVASTQSYPGSAAPAVPPPTAAVTYVKRSRTRNCPIHMHLAKDAKVTMARSKANEPFILVANEPCSQWDRQEPIVLPPMCTCENAELRDLYDSVLLPALLLEGQNQPNLPDGTKRILSNQIIKHSLGICNRCAGLQFVPFSFIEMPLTHAVSSIGEVIKHCPLPLETCLFVDPNKNHTVCLATCSPEHEWAVWQAIEEHLRPGGSARIYDVCSETFYPFQPNGSTQTQQQQQSSGMSQSPRQTPMISSDEKPFSSPLNPPKPVNLLNLVHYTRISNSTRLAGLRDRRPYCILNRKITIMTTTN